jgi:hypothetical protein
MFLPRVAAHQMLLNQVADNHMPPPHVAINYICASSSGSSPSNASFLG